MGSSGLRPLVREYSEISSLVNDVPLPASSFGGSALGGPNEGLVQDSASVEAGHRVARRVPRFDFDRNRPVMNRLQNSFYRRTFLPSLLAGDPVDVQGQSGYGEMLIYELLDDRKRNPIEAKRRLESLVGAYRGDDLPSVANYAMSDFYFLEGDFAAGYEALGIGIRPAHYLTLSAHLGHPPLAATSVLMWEVAGVTRKGIGRLDAILDALQALLDDFHALHGLSLIEDFWNRVTADKSVEEVAVSIEDEVLLSFAGDDVRAILSKARDDSTPKEPLRAFQWWPGYEEPIQWPAPCVSWSFHFALLFARVRALLREAENAARDKAEIPRVGEGWVSEMALLRQVQAAFPGERVVHQARPGWLAPQSLDIYFPDYNIGIEYQGTQHSSPVEHFGGAEALERQQERDARKLGICKEYGCVLIEVHPEYQLDHVIAQVKETIKLWTADHS